MSRNDAFDEGVGKSRERNVVKPRSLEERMPMLFDPQYDAPAEHQNYSASNAISGEINEGHQNSSVWPGRYPNAEYLSPGHWRFSSEPRYTEEVVRRQRRPIADARRNIKVWGLFHDPGNYAHPELSDAEPFTSISHARNEFHHRVNGGDSYYPAVSHQAELHLYLGGHPDEMQDPYPDRIIKKGPRGGTNVERA